jgi:hypothetical protein
MTFQALAYLTAIFGTGCGVLAILLTWAFNAALHWREEAGTWEARCVHKRRTQTLFIKR